MVAHGLKLTKFSDFLQAIVARPFLNLIAKLALKTSRRRHAHRLDIPAALAADELQQQTADCLGLFLLNPMSRAIDEMRATPLRTSHGLHPLKRARNLIDTPVALAGDETRGHIDGAARKRFNLDRKSVV